jgi:epsilon-lactone hydrolase
MTARHARRTRRVPHVPPAVLRLGARQLGRHCLNPALPWPVQRTRLDQLTRNSLLPRGTTITEQTIAGLRAEVIAAPAAGGQNTVLHFHGGGYCVGSPFMSRSWAAHLSAQAGYRVVVPEYRLAPEHPHPAALDDARAIWAELSADAGPGSVVVSGDSAGGGLALALLLDLRDQGQDLPAGAILLSPWLDLGRDRRADPDLVRRDVLLTPDWLEACARAYAAPAAWPDPSVSPLHAAHAGLPPLLIQAGTHELLAPDAALLAARARAAGVDVTYTSWPRLWHDFVLQPGLLAAADSAVAQASWFLTTVRPAAALLPARPGRPRLPFPRGSTSAPGRGPSSTPVSVTDRDQRRGPPETELRSHWNRQHRQHRQHRSPCPPHQPEPNEPRGSPRSNVVEAQVHLVHRRADLHDQIKLIKLEP